MNFAVVFTFAIAMIVINTVQGNFVCPPPQIKYYPVYVNNKEPNMDNTGLGCGYPPCAADNSLYPVCGGYNDYCKPFACINELYNDNCYNNKKYENVKLGYCDGLPQQGGPCKK